MKENMSKLDEKYKKLKGENKALCEYLNNLSHPVREEDQAFVPPTILLAESVEGIERIRQISPNVEAWVEGISSEAYIHAEDLVQIHERALV